MDLAALMSDPQVWGTLFTLTLLEIVLGIDNVIFISILAGRLPAEQQNKARVMGLMLALVGRLALLASFSYIIRLTSPLFEVFGQSISGKDLVLLLGGLFLLWKSTTEVFHYVEGDSETKIDTKPVSFGSVIFQVLLIDLVFSLDSVITAVGMTPHVVVAAIAIVIAVIIMLVFAGKIANFINQHPSVKLLALGFLIMIGALLIAEAFDQHIPKGYMYFAMTFSLVVEVINIQRRKHQGKPTPVELKPLPNKPAVKVQND